MVDKKEILFLVMIVLGVFVSLNFVTAFQFNGTVYDINSNPLNNTVINITVRNAAGFTIVGYNFTTTNASGWFNMSVDENAQWMYQPVIIHKNGSYYDYVGQSLPAFPSEMIKEIANTNYYLREAGTINITAINSTAGRIGFNYQVKDTRLGYMIASSFGTGGTVTEVSIVLPKDRNYSVMVYPNQSLPANFNWNNFTTNSSYTIVDSGTGNISSYNATTRTLHKMFNITLSLPRVGGFINASGVSVVAGWNEFSVVPFMIEPGNMIHATHGGMPFNLSTFFAQSDMYTLTTGFYNITLPASAESVDYLLFASARNGTGYYGGVANLTLSYGASDVRVNITMHGLLGRPSNFSIDDAGNFSAPKKRITTAKQSFQVVNSSNYSLVNSNVHAEITVNYSAYGAMELTWMEDVPQESGGNFSVPLLNITGIKEMNLFVGGGNYAPKRTSFSVVDLLNANNRSGNVTNISVSSFNPGAIESTLQANRISMSLYVSNSSCDLPDPVANCVLGGTEQDMSTFEPMSVIIGGGKLSFRMGTGGIKVHYVNVDMLASGPPDALFDDSPKNGTSGSSFSSALRFGSGGPKIYDYVMVSMSYSDTAGVGLNDSAGVNVSIPYFYDDNWNIIWNGTVNGTNVTNFALNNSHYAERQNEWQTLMNNVTCVTNQNNFNVTSPCFINTSTNQIWIRIPHFSGTGPTISGSAIVATSSSSSGSSSSGSGVVSSYWINTFAHDKSDFSEIGDLNRYFVERQRARIRINDEIHYIGVTGITTTTATVNLSSENSQQAMLNVGDEKKFEITNDNYYDLSVKLEKIVARRANLTISYLHEVITQLSPEEKKNETALPAAEGATIDREFKEEAGFGADYWIVVVIVVVITVGVVSYIIRFKIKNYK